jgi:8-oxo-dGTP pyrophosphatase MutT (NUDIX family)
MPGLPPSALSPWALDRRETLAEHPVFSVLRSHYADGPTGPRKAIYTIACPDWCNVLAVTPDANVVLVRQFRFGTDRISLEVPGGMIEAGEDPRSAVRRELEEETGYVAGDVTLLSSLCPNPALQGNRIYSYVAWNAVPAREGALHGVAAELEECETVLWPRANLADLLDDGAVDHSLCAIVLETFLRKFGPK